MNTTLAGSTLLASQAQAQLSFLQYRASQVMQPDNSDVEHDLPQVGQNVCSALYLFLFFAGVAIRSRSGKGLAEGEGFRTFDTCYGVAAFKNGIVHSPSLPLSRGYANAESLQSGDKSKLHIVDVLRGARIGFL